MSASGRVSGAVRALGWLGKWTTLLSCAALAVGLVWLAKVGTPRVLAIRPAGMAWSDRVSLPRTRRTTLEGWTYPALRTSDAPLVVAVDPQGRRLLSYGVRGNSVDVPFEAVTLGLTRVPIVGLPHGPLAYQRATVSVLGVPADQPFWLIDAALLRALSATDADELLAALPSHATVAMVHLGKGPELGDAMRDARARYPQLPVLGMGGKDQTDISTLIQRARNHTRQWPSVITADPAAATALAVGRAKVHLVGTGPAASAPPGVTSYADLRTLKEKLANGPIGQ